MEKHKHVLTLLCLFALVFALFGGTLSHGLNSDDYLVLYHALHRSPATPADGIGEFLKPSWGLYYRPAIKVFFEALGGLSGLWSGGYHLVSLICYVLLCFEVYLLGLLLTERWHIAAAAAIIFMVSTAHGEVLFWISCLNGVVENVLTLASLICFVYWRTKSERLFYSLSVVLFVLALFTKESAISLPIILVLYDFLLGGEVRWDAATKRTAKSCWRYVFIGIMFVFLRSAIMKQISLPPSLTTFGWQTLMTAFWHSLIMTLSPIDWALALGWFKKLTASRILFYLITALGMAMIVIIPLVLKRFRVAFLLLWILAGAAPIYALGLVPSERHIVIGSAGAAILISIALFALAESMTRKAKLSPIALGCVFVVVFAAPGCYFLKQRQGVWKHASEIANTVVEQTMDAYPDPPPNTTFFFLNVPDSIDGALVFRFENLAYALRLFYEDNTIEVVRIAALDQVPSPALSTIQSAYFRIKAMGSNIWFPASHSRSPLLAERWQKLEQLQILTRDVQYSGDWDRYDGSPFFIYAGEVLTRAPSNELKAVLEDLYSLY